MLLADIMYADEATNSYAFLSNMFAESLK